MKYSKTHRAFIAAAFATISGCATSTSDGVVAMKIDDRIAHILLAPEAFRPGDSVALIESHCASGPRLVRTRKPQSDKCKKIVAARGIVTRALNDRYAEVEFPQGVEFDEGDAVRKE